MPQSRKDKRKKERQEKNERKRQNHLNLHKEKLRKAQALHEEKQRKSVQADLKKRRRQRDEAKNTPQVTEDDMEIEYLERKLGLGSKRTNRNKESSWKRLEKEFQDDGFNNDLLSLLSDIDSGRKLTNGNKESVTPKTSTKSKSLDDSDEASMSDGDASDTTSDDNEEHDADLGHASEKTSDSDQEEDEEVADTFDMEIDKDQGVEDDDEEEEDDGLEIGDDTKIQGVSPNNVTYMPKSNLYGETSEPSAPAEPRRFSFFKNTGEMMRLRRVLNGLINRMAESNIQPISTQIDAMYGEHPMRSLNELLCDIIFAGLSNHMVILVPLATCFAALVAALSMSRGNELAAFVLEKTVVRFDKIFAEDKQGTVQDGGENIVSKRCSNLAVFMCHLYLFGVVHHALIFDLVMELANDCNPNSIQVISVVFTHAGSKLRKDDPARLATLIRTLQENAPEDDDNEANAAESDEGRMHFLMDQMNMIKNNRTPKESGPSRLLTWVRKRRLEYGTGSAQLQLKWNELLHAETQGRWWIVGGVWKAQQDALDRGISERLNGDSVKSSRGGVSGALASADSKLLTLARKMRMNTDVRRAAFVEIMGAQSVREALDRLTALNLKDRQEREIVHVLMRCCGASKDYNVFFEELALALCHFKHQFKFTFQLAYWDTFKEMESLKPRRAGNLAKLLASLVSQYSLSLAVLKSVEFPSLLDRGIFFFNIFFNFFLCTGGDTKEGARRVARCFNRVGASGDFESVADGITFFFHHHLMGADDGTLLYKRMKIAKRVIDALILHRATQPMADNDDSYFDDNNNNNE